MQSNIKFTELNDLLSRLCDGEMDRPDWDRLETLLLNDPAAQDYYRRFVVLDVDLAWRAGGRSADLPLESSATEARGAEDEGRGMTDLPAIDASVGPTVEHPVGAAVQLPHQHNVEPPQQLDPESQIPEPPFPVLFTANYPLPTAPFVGSWAFSYMVAT
ncbi:MAG: hypothetical protein K8R46_10370, partial [Pirellulales bacterium]|nr:hypothetical protein [Pirellulales bacterium]